MGNIEKLENQLAELKEQRSKERKQTLKDLGFVETSVNFSLEGIYVVSQEALHLQSDKDFEAHLKDIKEAIKVNNIQNTEQFDV